MRPDPDTHDMPESRSTVLYLHGFNSSPVSAKARQFTAFCAQHAQVDVGVPQLPHHPAEALALLRELVEARSPALIIGSSLGGFYATILAEQYGMRAALINPAVAPCRQLGEEFLGQQRNLYTGEEYEFTRGHAAALEAMTPESLKHPQRFLVLLQTGDQVLDYRIAADFYQRSHVVVTEGGSHDFDNFSDVLPQICRFGGIELT